MRRPITEDERTLAQIEIDVRRRAVRYGLMQSFEGRVLDETNEAGEVVIKYSFVCVPQLETFQAPVAGEGGAVRKTMGNEPGE